MINEPTTGSPTPLVSPFVPGTVDYESETAGGANRAFTCRPDAVLAPADVDDVRAGIAWAKVRHLPVHVRATGHGAHDDIRGGLLLNTRLLDTLELDPTAGTVRVGAGVRWEAVIAAAAEHGLAPIAGTSPDVGVVGYLLGAGLGPLARSHGYSTDYLVSARLVTWSGDVVEASPRQNPELLWALRGGRPDVGIVTEVTIRLARLSRLYGGYLTFGTDSIDHAFRTWARWIEVQDSRMTTTAVFTRPPDGSPKFLSIHVAFTGTAEEGAQRLEPLRAMDPRGDTVTDLHVASVARVFDDPSGPAPVFSQGLMLSSFDSACVEALLALFGQDGTMPFVKGQVRHLGGAVQTDVDEGSAAPGRSCPIILGTVGLLDPTLGIDHDAAMRRVQSSLHEWASSELTANFAGETEPVWSAATTARLREVERTWSARATPDDV